MFTKMLLSVVKATTRNLDNEVLRIHNAIEHCRIAAVDHHDRIDAAIGKLVAEREEAKRLTQEIGGFYGGN